MRDAISDLVGNDMCDAPTRQNKAIVFNACELRTTTAFRMSNQKFGSWRFGWSDASNIGVADAVTASAAFPPLLPPFDWTREFTKKDLTSRQRVLITDGGVFENMGVSVMEPGRDSSISAISHLVPIIIASDASAGQLSGGDLPASWASRMSQAFNAVMRKVNDATKQRLHAQAAYGEIGRFVYANFGQIDQQVPIKSPGWIDRKQVVNYPTNFSSMSSENIQGLSGRGESITRALVTMYLLSD
jgi:NTE family protein